MIKILYVDDEPLLLDLARVFIEKKGEFTVDTAETAPAALELMKSRTYDAIISDYQMPEMDGIEFLKTIRDSGDRTPFIIFTGRGREEIAIQAFENGADFYIQKGGDPNAQFAELLHKVNQAITLRETEAALRDSEEKYRLLVEKANEAILIAQDRLVRFSNPRFSSILGIPVEGLIGKPIAEIVHPDDHELVLGRYDQRISGENVPENYEFRIVDSSGVAHWVMIHATRILWEKIPALLILLDEITARKAAEEELRRNYDELEQKENLLRESEEKYRRIVENAEEGIWEMNSHEITTFVNSKMAKMLGYSVDEMLGKKLTSFIPEEEIEDHRRLVGRRKTGISDHYVRLFLKKDGETRWMKVKATSLIDENGNFSGSFAMISDITEQKLAEDALKENRRRLMDIIDFLPDATFVIDTGGRVIAWNRAIEDMTGVKTADIIGKGNYEYALPFYKVRRPVMADLVLNFDSGIASNYPSLKREGSKLISEIAIPHFNEGKGAHMWFISTPLYDAEGKITGAIESIRDITAKKEAEEALIKRNEELGAAYGQLTAMEEEIRQSYEELEKSHRELGESEEKYRDLIDNAPIGIFTATSDGRFLTINGTGAKILGYSSPEDATGDFGVLKNAVCSDPGRNALLWDLLDEKGHVEDFGMEFIMQDGTIRRSININARVSQRNKDGTFIVQGFFNDITYLKGIHGALENANHQLKLLTGVTRHDILNSVMAAYCYIEMLKNPGDPEHDQYLKTLLEILQKIQKQVEFTKEFENIGSRAPLWQNLADILQKIKESSPLPLETTGCDIELFADPILMKVFETFLDNTLRHGGEGVSRIKVSCRESGNNDYIIVWEDDGAGIPDINKDQIFERGFGKNTGLGLFLVWEILGTSGIKIKETGCPGEGARFEMTVPDGKFHVISG